MTVTLLIYVQKYMYLLSWLCLSLFTSLVALLWYDKKKKINFGEQKFVYPCTEIYKTI